MRDLRVGSMILKDKKELMSNFELPKSCFQLNDNFDLDEVYKPETPKANAKAQPGTQIKHGQSSHEVLDRLSGYNIFCGN